MLRRWIIIYLYQPQKGSSIMAVYPPRNKVEKKQTWNAESVFKNQRAWQAELDAVLSDLDSVKRFQGRLGESPAALLDGLSAYESLIARA
jgi:oligoendopeptidase F